MNLHLWRVKYASRFSSSGTDTGHYHVDTFDHVDHVLSSRASIDSMESELALGLSENSSGQKSLLKVQEATYLGMVVNHTDNA